MSVLRVTQWLIRVSLRAYQEAKRQDTPMYKVRPPVLVISPCTYCDLMGYPDQVGFTYILWTSYYSILQQHLGCRMSISCFHIFFLRKGYNFAHISISFLQQKNVMVLLISVSPAELLFITNKRDSLGDLVPARV